MRRQQYERCGKLQKVLIDLEVTLFLFKSAHIRAGPFLVPSAVEGVREGASGANKESGGRFAH